MGLYLYAVGASRQLTSVLNSLGICSSYSTLVGSEQQAPKDSDNTGHSSESEDDPDWIPDTSDSDGESSKWESSSGNSESESESPSDSEVERNSRVEGVQVGSINKVRIFQSFKVTSINVSLEGRKWSRDRIIETTLTCLS